MEENQRAIGCLKRLATSLKDLSQKEGPPQLSHWRDCLPEALTTACQVLKQGGELVRATSTKFTLVSKIDLDEGSKLAKDLLKGCELLGTATLVIYDNSVGCSLSMRVMAKQSTRAVIHSCINLLECFLDNKKGKIQGDVVPAQKTGAVWDACDKLNKFAYNNRNAMRRDLMTWMIECKETLEEFSYIVKNSETIAMSDPHEYFTCEEIPIITPSLALVKCSRGSINLVLKACEIVGTSLNQDNSRSILMWIANIHDAARRVGVGMTDLATLFYPPLQGIPDLLQEVESQSKAIIDLQNLILDTPPVDFPDDLVSTSQNIRNATLKRAKEASEGIKDIAERKKMVLNFQFLDISGND